MKKAVNGKVEEIRLKSLCCSLKALLSLESRCVGEGRYYLQIFVTLQENKY